MKHKKESPSSAGQGNTQNRQFKDTKKPIRYHKSDAVKYLESLADDAARKKYPNTPPHYLAPRKFRDDTANSLTNCIIDFLRFSGHQAERISNTGRMIDTRTTFEDVTGKSRTIGTAKWIKGTGTNGTADISATIGGRSVKVEVKFGKDWQSETQMKYQLAVEQAGGIYFIAKSFEQFLTWFQLTVREVNQ